VAGLDENGILYPWQLPFKIFSETITGDGQKTEFIISHYLNSIDLIVQVRDSVTLAAVLVDNTLVDINTLKIIYSTAPDTGKLYRVNIIGLTDNQASGKAQKIVSWNDSQTWDDGLIWDDGDNAELPGTVWKDSQAWDDNKVWEG